MAASVTLAGGMWGLAYERGARTVQGRRPERERGTCKGGDWQPSIDLPDGVYGCGDVRMHICGAICTAQGGGSPAHCWWVLCGRAHACGGRRQDRKTCKLETQPTTGSWFEPCVTGMVRGTRAFCKEAWQETAQGQSDQNVSPLLYFVSVVYPTLVCWAVCKQACEVRQQG